MIVLNMCQTIRKHNLEIKFHNVLMSKAAKSWNIEKNSTRPNFFAM